MNKWDLLRVFLMSLLLLLLLSFYYVQGFFSFNYAEINEELPKPIISDNSFEELKLSQVDVSTANKSNLGFDIQKSFKEDRDKVMNLFNRKGAYYDFGPSPVIWNCKVWESLFDNYMKPNNLSFKDLISFSPSEFTWYGEWLLISKIIPLYPKQPLMKVFHYGQQYQEAKQKGYTENDYSKNYLGIIMQSNWGAPLKYE